VVPSSRSGYSRGREEKNVVVGKEKRENNNGGGGEVSPQKGEGEDPPLGGGGPNSGWKEKVKVASEGKKKKLCWRHKQYLNLKASVLETAVGEERKL